MRTTVASTLVLMLCTSSCALLGMRSPKTTDTSQRPDCSDSRGGVAIDGVFTALYGLGGLAAMSNGEGSTGVPLLLLGGIHAASALAGNRSASRCSEAFKRHDEWLREARMTRSSQDAPRADPSDTTGTLGGRCYGNRTCDDGLLCDVKTRRCIEAPPDVSPAALRRFQQRANTAPANSQTRQQTRQTRPPPRARTRPAPPDRATARQPQRPPTTQPRQNHRARAKPPRSKPAKAQPPKARPPRSQPPKTQPPRQQPPKTQPPRKQPPRSQPPKTQPPRQQPPRKQPPRKQPPRKQPPKTQPPKTRPPGDDTWDDFWKEERS